MIARRHAQHPRLTVSVVVLLLVATAGIGLAGTPAVSAQDDPTPVPATYYGNVTIDGEPAPAGTTITAEIDGEVRGSITIDSAGQYGGPTVNDERLVVNGTQADSGAEVTFRINGDAVGTEPASVLWESATDTRVDIVAEDIPTAQFDLTLNESASALTVSEGSEATVAVDVTNTGNATGTTSVAFARNGSVVETTTVALDPTATTTVAFTTLLETSGEIPITVTAANAELTVTTEATATGGGGGGGGAQPSTGDETPPVFNVSSLAPQTATVTAGEMLDVSATITNTGSAAGNQAVTLQLAGETVATESVTLRGDEMITVSFSDVPLPDETGTISHGIFTGNDSQTGTLTIEAAAGSGDDSGNDSDSGSDAGDGDDQPAGNDTSADGTAGEENDSTTDPEATDDSTPGFTLGLGVIAVLITVASLRVRQQ